MTGPGWQQQPQQQPQQPYPRQQPYPQQPGYPRQQPYQQQPPFPPGPGWGQPGPPRPRSKAPKILLIIAVVLVVLGGGGFVGWRVVYGTTDGGVEATGKQPMKECAASQPVLDAAKTSVNTGSGFSERTYTCSYATLKGSDGTTQATMTVTVQTLDARVVAEDKTVFENAVHEFRTNYKVKDGPKIGDRSAYLWDVYNDRTYLVLAVLKGTTLLKVGYYGYTKGFFGDTPVPAAQMEPRLLDIAKDLEPRLPK